MTMVYSGVPRRYSVYYDRGKHVAGVRGRYICQYYTIIPIGRYTALLYRHGAATQSYTKRDHRTHCRPSRVLLLMLMILTMYNK